MCMGGGAFLLEGRLGSIAVASGVQAGVPAQLLLCSSLPPPPLVLLVHAVPAEAHPVLPQPSFLPISPGDLAVLSPSTLRLGAGPRAPGSPHPKGPSLSAFHGTLPFAPQGQLAPQGQGVRGGGSSVPSEQTLPSASASRKPSRLAVGAGPSLLGPQLSCSHTDLPKRSADDILAHAEPALAHSSWGLHSPSPSGPGAIALLLSSSCHGPCRPPHVPLPTAVLL